MLTYKHLLFLFLFSFAAVAQEVDDIIPLNVGFPSDKVIEDLPNAIDVEGTFRKVTHAEYDAATKSIRFNPFKEGSASFVIKEKGSGKILYKFTIDARKTDLQRVAKEMQALLATIEGITIRIINNKVVVDGQILLPTDMKRIHSVVKQYGNLATTLVILSPIAQNKIAEFIERKINNPEIRCSAVNGKFILEGFATDQPEKDKSEIIAKMYIPDVVVDEAVADKKVLERKVDMVINLINLRAPPQPEPAKLVQMVIHYVELQKDYSRSFRFQWTPDIGDGSSVGFSTGGAGQGGVVSTITGTISNLLPKLNWAKQHGFARVLQSSSLIVQDGKAGILNSITRLPYQVVNAQGQPSTNFEETGIKTNVTPEIMGQRSDSVKLALNFAVKSLISYTAQGPTTSSREMQTTIHVKSGASAAVGGLITSDTGTDFNKLPANGSTNPLISLYASKDFRNNQSQFVVFVTPIIKSSASTGSDKIKQKFRMSN